MVYECPQCKTSLPPGVMACAKCGLQFATPIPADATIPAPGAPPLNTTETTGFSPLATDNVPPRRVVAVVVALGLVLVAAALFAIYTFSRTPVPDAPPPLPTASTLPPPPNAGLPTGNASRSGLSTASPASAGNIAPIQLSGGSGSSSGGAAASGSGDAALQGRWEAKNMDYYVFNGDGTGSRGNTTKPAKTDNFTWVVTNNQLVLNSGKEERLTFSTGPDASILYLRMSDGRFNKFARAGAS